MSLDKSVQVLKKSKACESIESEPLVKKDKEEGSKDSNKRIKRTASTILTRSKAKSCQSTGTAGGEEDYRAILAQVISRQDECLDFIKRVHDMLLEELPEDT